MAIDSAEKRRAVAALSLFPIFGPGVTPNAAQDQEWRQEAGYGYPGILASAAAPDTSGTRRQRQIKSLVRARRRRR